ncbi:MAG: hypothetical protein HZC28_00380 [Spirochaetes bacterium]|nr:hypothetical protein [Spirochaetota bacterium]
MVRIVLVCAMSFALAVSAFAQTDAKKTNDSSSNIVQSLHRFAPTFPFLRSTDSKNDTKDFEALKKLLDEVRDDYLVRVQIKADKIIEEYKRDHLGQTSNEFESTLNNYNVISRSMEMGPNIRLGLDRIEKGFQIFNYIKPSILVDSSRSNDVSAVEYRLYLYSGILNLFYGTRYSMMHALKDFSYLVDSGVVPSDEELITVNNYLAGLNYNFALINLSDSVMQRHHLNLMFDNLWDLTELINKADQQKKDYKLMQLVKEYAPIINPFTARFRTKYQTYFDKLGLNYGKTEERAIESAEKKEKAAAPTTAPTPAGGAK